MKNLVDERPTRELHGRLAWTRAFVDEADLAGRDVLDIGCGFGWFELVALDRGARSITGVEPAEADLTMVRRYFDGERVAFRAGSALDLPFPDETFDTVVCWEVLEHLPRGSELRALRELHRVLRREGVLYLSTPHASPLATALDPARWLIGHRHYSRTAVASLATSAGFRVDRLELRGRGWELAQLVDLYVSKWVLRRRPLFEAALNRRLDVEWERPGFTNVFLRARRRS